MLRGLYPPTDNLVCNPDNISEINTLLCGKEICRVSISAMTSAGVLMSLRSLFWELEINKLQQIFRRFLLPSLIFLSLGLFLALVANTLVEHNRVHSLTIAAGFKDGESYLFAQVMARVVTKYEPKIQIQILETPGTVDNLEQLQKNKVQLAMAQADIPAPPSAQVVTLLFPDLYQLIATKQSGIKTVQDLRGKRVGLPPKDGGQYNSFLFLAKHYGLNPTDPNYTDMADDQAVDTALLNNQVDAVFHVRPPGNQAIRNLVQHSQGQLIPIDQAGAMKLKQPSLDATFIPKGTYQGIPPIPATDQPTVAVQRLLLANQGVNEEIIRQITTILYEHRQDLVTAMPLAASISSPSAVNGAGLPIHPGAQAYYDRTKPAFIEEHASVLELLLSISLLVGSWFWQLKLRIEQKQKDKADDYIREVMALLYANDCIQEVIDLMSATQPSVQEIQQTVQAIFEQANKALADQEKARKNLKNQKGSQGSLQSFQVALQLATDTIAQAIALMGANQSNNTTKIQVELEQLYKKCKQALAQIEGIENDTQQISPESLQSFKLRSNQKIQQALNAILKRAVKALAEARVSPESFQSLRTIWQMASNEVTSSEYIMAGKG